MTYLLIALTIALITAFIIFIIINYNKIKNAINNEIATTLKKIGEKKFKNYDFNDKVYKSLYNELKEEISSYRKIMSTKYKKHPKTTSYHKIEEIITRHYEQDKRIKKKQK